PPSTRGARALSVCPRSSGRASRDGDKHRRLTSFPSSGRARPRPGAPWGEDACCRPKAHCKCGARVAVSAAMSLPLRKVAQLSAPLVLLTFAVAPSASAQFKGGGAARPPATAATRGPAPPPPPV